MILSPPVEDPRWLCLIGLIDNKNPALGGLERAQALRSFLMPTSESSPAMMPSSHSGLVGTGVAAAGAAQTADAVVRSTGESKVPMLKVCGQPVFP